MEDVHILLVEGKITNVTSMLPILKKVVGSRKRLLIIAENIETEPLSTLILNKLQGGLEVCAVKAPGFGDNRTNNLQDIAILTGGTVNITKKTKRD